MNAVEGVVASQWLCMLVNGQRFFMVALWHRANHNIFMLWFVLVLLSFFPRLISAATEWMSAILPHMVWP